MTKTSRAFITGASGLVGGHLLAGLVDEGWSVVALARSSEAARTIAARGGVAVRGDLLDATGLATLMKGAEVVFHVAGVNDTCPRDPDLMNRVNIEGTRSVIRAAGAAGADRVVYTSSAAAIGEPVGIVATEETAHSGVFLSPYARSKYLAEIAAFAEADEQEIDLVAVNPSSVQGPDRVTGSAEILIRILKSERPVLVDTNLSIVDIEDCTNGHIAAASLGEPGKRYLLSARSITVADAVSSVADVLGHPIRPRWISPGIVKSIGLPVAWAAGKVTPDRGICPALVRTLLHGHRFDSSRASSDLGITFRPAWETLGRTAEWLDREGYLGPDR